MATTKQVRAAQRNVKKAQAGARKKRSIASMPAKTRTALGKQGAAVAKRKRTGSSSPKTRPGALRGGQAPQPPRALEDGPRTNSPRPWAASSLRETTKRPGRLAETLGRLLPAEIKRQRRASPPATACPAPRPCGSRWGPCGRIRPAPVALAIGVLDVRLEAERVAQAGLGEPDDVVVLVLRASDLASFGISHRSPSLRRLDEQLARRSSTRGPGTTNARQVERRIAESRGPHFCMPVTTHHRDPPVRTR